MKNKFNVTRNWCLKIIKIVFLGGGGGGGGSIGISPRASNWLETALRRRMTNAPSQFFLPSRVNFDCYDYPFELQ